MAAVMTGLIAASVYFHGTWYLWVLPVAAFFLAGQFRWGFTRGRLLGRGRFAGQPADRASWSIIRCRPSKWCCWPPANTSPSAPWPLNCSLRAATCTRLYMLGGLLRAAAAGGAEGAAVFARPRFLAGGPDLGAGFSRGPFLERLGLARVDGADGRRPAMLLASRLAVDSFAAPRSPAAWPALAFLRSPVMPAAAGRTTSPNTI